MTTTDTYLQRYADLIVRYGLNVQEGQLVQITSETTHHELVQLVVERAYQAGACYVHVELIDPHIDRARLLYSDSTALSFVPNFVRAKFEELTDSRAATLRITGSEFPELLTGIDAKRINTARSAVRRAAQRFYVDGVEKGQVHWCVAAAPAKGWATKVFPDLSPDVALDRLWNEMVKILRLDQLDPVSEWRIHDDKLKARCRALDALKISELRFVGPGTDLKVGMHALARFKGGTEISPRGVSFEPNLPTEECFSIPDCRLTEGVARATRPFLVNGTMIKDLQFRFEAGMLVDFSCSSGEETFREYLDTDGGARRLGEVALVGIDSPVFRSGHVFREILYDENAACHVAVGMAYRNCIEGGESMTDTRLREVGCNESIVHTDIMISSEEVSVIAKTSDGSECEIIERGVWKV